MTLDLAGAENDFERTNARTVFSAADYGFVVTSDAPGFGGSYHPQGDRAIREKDTLESGCTSLHTSTAPAYDDGGRLPSI